MNEVQPIRDREKIQQMKDILGKTSECATDQKQMDAKRNRMIFVTGINSGLRVSDIRTLNIEDVMNEDYTIKDHISIIETKTKKPKKFPINDSLKNELQEYISSLFHFKYSISLDSKILNNQERIKEILTHALFPSSKGGYLTRIQIYRILNEASKIVGLEEIGTHTMRKTFGYFFYLQKHDIAMLQKLFNHSSPSVTLRYIGIEQDQIDQAYNDFSL